MKKSYLDFITKESHIREVDQADTSKLFAESISALRSAKGYTQDDMAYLLGIGKQTYVRIEAGTNATVNAEIAIKAANIFRVPVMSLFGFSTDNIEAYKDYMRCTDRTKRLLRAVAKADILAQEQLAEYEDGDLITILSFSEEIHDGMNFNRFMHRNVNISQYRHYRWYQEADCALEVNSNAYHPLYHVGDILIVCSRAPLDGEIGVFLKGGCFYLRKVQNSPETTYLTPVAYFENTPLPEIVINRHNPEDMRLYTKMGTVVAVI